MKDEATLKKRYQAVQQRIAAAAVRSGRHRDDVLLTIVTKLASIDQIRQLLELGHMDFGENRVQALMHRAAQIDEFLQRHRQLSGSKVVNMPGKLRWHMVGHLQRNKVAKVLKLVRLIHSVDSLRLAEEIQTAAARYEDPVEVLIQVNTTGEKDKHGVAPAAAVHLIEQIDDIRTFVSADATGEREPTRKGIAIPIKLLDDVIETLHEAQQQAKASGLLKAEAA